MNPHVKNFDDRLLSLFEKRAQEFVRFSEEQPRTARVARQLADLYMDLANLIKR